MDVVEHDTLVPIVRLILNDKSVSIADWSQEPLDGGLSGAAVTRFKGMAYTATGCKPWSIIRKVLRATNGDQNESAANYWKREVLVYQSGLLNNLPINLITPRCIEITKQNEDEYWLWLEDMGNGEDPGRSFEQYGSAARHLGQFNGAYLVGRSLPIVSWLCSLDLGEQLELAEQGICELPLLSQNPHFSALLTGRRADRIAKLWNRREHLLRALEKLPKTFCHGDAFRRNLLFKHNQEGCEQTIIFDWGSARNATLGQELVTLFAGTLAFVELDIEQRPEQIAELDALIFKNYLVGLQDAGWNGDSKWARFGFAALTALQVGVVEPAIKLPSVARRIAALPSGVEPPRLLNPGGPAQAAAVGHYLLDLGEEALTLSEQLA